MLTSPNFHETMGQPDSTNIGFIVSSMKMGAMCSCIPAAWLADSLSRRFGIFAGAVTVMIGCALQAAAQDLSMMINGRFYAGFGFGALIAIAPVYQAEIALPSTRGRLTLMQQLFVGFGSTIASFTTFATTSDTQLGPALQWRLPLAFQIIPCIPLAIGIWWLPESPRWLIKNGYKDDGLDALTRLHGSETHLSELLIKGQFARIQEESSNESHSRSNSAWKRLLSEYQTIRKVALSVALQFSVQLTGINLVAYYTPTLLANFGISSQHALLLLSDSNVMGNMRDIGCALLVDRMGRRWLSICCNVGVGLTSAMATAILARYSGAETTLDTTATRFFIAVTWIYRLIYGLGVGPLSSSVPVELLDTHTRAKGYAISALSGMIAIFWITQVSPLALATIGWRYYIIFAVFGFTNALSQYVFLPETGGRTLEEMNTFVTDTPLFVPQSKQPCVTGWQCEKALIAFGRTLMSRGPDALSTPTETFATADPGTDDWHMVEPSVTPE